MNAINTAIGKTLSATVLAGTPINSPEGEKYVVTESVVTIEIDSLASKGRFSGRASDGDRYIGHIANGTFFPEALMRSSVRYLGFKM